MSSALFDKSKDTLYNCMYRLGMFVLYKESEKIIMDQSNILSIEKMDNFEYNIRSIIKVKVQLDIRQKAWIIKNKSSINCKFELDKFGFDQELEEEIVGEQTVWNTEFAVFLNDDDANMDVTSIEQSLQINEGDEFNINNIEDRGYYTDQEVIDLYLYNRDLINASRKNINKVFSSVLIQDAVSSILSESGHKNVLMSPVENNNVQSELLIPSYPSYKAIVYLDQYYGLYKRGASIFYDVDTLYIINPNGKATALRDNEWPETQFLITSRMDSLPGNGMVRKQNQNVFYLNVPEEGISPQNLSEAKSAKYGSTIQLITMDDVKVETTKVNESNNGNVYRAYQNSTDNIYASDIIKSRMEENEAIMYITGNNYDINAFTLNKVYRLTFENTDKQLKFGKNVYRIAFANHRLVQQGDYMKSLHQIALKKCSSNN